MGVTIYYRGRLKSLEELPKLLFAVEDIADTMNWPYKSVDDPWDTPIDVAMVRGEDGAEFVGNAGLKGLIINPHPEAEPLWLTFNNKGELRTVISVALMSDYKPGNYASTKTQFAGVDLHIRLIKLLKYLGESFFGEFELRDDCGYAESEDREKAVEIFSVIDTAMVVLEEAFEGMTAPPTTVEDMDKLISQIEDKIKQSGLLGTMRVMRIDEEE